MTWSTTARTSEPPLAGGEQPLSRAQEAIWTLERLHGGSSPYHLPLALDLDGDLDESVLRAALTAVLARHPLLAGSVRSRDGVPQIHPAARAPRLETTQLRSTGPGRAAELDRLTAQEVVRPFDLERGPLLHARLLIAGPRQSRLVVVAHHIVFDGTSKDIFVRDLLRLYRSGGRPVDPPPSAVELLVRQERARIRSSREAARIFWPQADSAPAEVILPGHRRPPARWAAPAAACDLSFDPAFSRRLDEIAAATEATRFEILLTILQTLLLRYGTENPSVGIDFGTRPAAARDSIGVFVTELPVRAGLWPDLTVRAAIGRVAAAVRAVSTHRVVPLGEALGANAARHHRAAVSMSYRRRSFPPPDQPDQSDQPDQPDPLELPGLRVRVKATMFAPAQRPDLHLNVLDSGTRIEASLRYALDALSEPDARRIATHVRELAYAVLDHPDARLGDLTVMPARERSRVLLTGRSTDTSAAETLDVLLDRQAARTPEAVAVVAGEAELTYAQLHRRAQVLAGWLNSTGVGPESVVAVCAERSPELVVALLAVLKAGAAFLPLDPDLPDERLAFMLRDSGAALVLTQSRLQGRVTRPGPPVVSLAGDGSPRWETAVAPGIAVVPGTDSAAAPVRARARPGNAAYVIYTSGSTGAPKGVVNTHRGVVNRLVWMQQRYRLRDDDVVLQKTPIGFDVSVWEFFWPLLAGARLVLCPPGAHRDPERLRLIIAENNVTTVHFVPSMLTAFLAGGTGTQTGCASLRRIICSGEELPVPVARQCLELLPGELHNLYGPTEAAIDVSAWPCRLDALAGADRVPLGRPIDNTALYVLDPRLQPVPVGVPGELCIGGLPPARGYLNQPGLTADRFRPDPHGLPGSRLYRTGDRARLRSDGLLEYLGRLDNQVKISGVRVELGEVESALRAQPGIQDAAAAVRDGGTTGGTGDPRLIGYVVVTDGSRLDRAGLRQGLRGWLPEQMIPSILVELPALPLSRNGKLDRKALPGPPRGRDDEHSGAPAGTDEETAVRQVWAQVLGATPASAGDDFFAAGGTSLLAVRLTALLRDRLGRELTLRDVFDHPTPGALAEAVATASPAGGERSADRPAAGLRTRSADRIPTTYLQGEHWRREHRGVATQAGISLLYRLRGPLDVEALRRSIDRLVQRHEVLRTTYAQEGDVLVGLVAPTGGIDVPLVDVSGLAGARRADAADRHLVEAADAPYDLGRGPVLRAGVIRLAELDHVLLLGVHHIAADDWSMQLLTSELGRLYAAEKSGTSAALDPLPRQYRDYVSWQRRRMDERLAVNLSFWRRQLADLPPRLRLPGCADPADVHSLRRLRHRLAVPPESLHALADFSRSAGATPFLGVVAAFGMCLAATTGQDDVMIASLFAGRDRVEFEPVVGMFTDLTVLRASLAGDPDFAQVLHRFREVALDAHQHKDLHLRQFAREIGLGDPAVLQLPIWNIWANATLSRRGRLGIRHELALDGLTVTGYDPRTDRTQIKPAAIWEGDNLSLVSAGEDGEAELFVDYNTEFFPEGAAEDFSRTLGAVLELVASRPSASLSAVRRLIG